MTSLNEMYSRDAQKLLDYNNATPSDSPAIRAALGIRSKAHPITPAIKAFLWNGGHTMPDESKLTGWIGVDGKPEIYRTPLQTLAAHLKALTWREMQALCCALDDAFPEDAENVDPFALLAAADALEAGE